MANPERRAKFLPLTSATSAEPISESDLANQGFDKNEVSRLNDLKNTHSPFAEHFDSTQEWRQLQFFRWICQHGGCADYPLEKRVDNELAHWCDTEADEIPAFARQETEEFLRDNFK